MESPLSTSIPAFKDGDPVTPELSNTKLSSTLRFAVFKVVVLPLTVKSPVTVRLFEIVTLAGRLSVIAAVSDPEPVTVISFAVPAIVAT